MGDWRILLALFHRVFGGVSTALWQARVPPQLQGRGFAARRVVAQFTVPIALLMVGPVTDYFFEPAMMPGGSLALLHDMISPGPGAGMALMHVIAGICGALIASIAWRAPGIRSLEDVPPLDAVSLPAVTS